MSDFFKSLFGGQLDLGKLKVKLKQVERERKKHFAEIGKLNGKQSILINKAKEARKSGNSSEVDYVWEDLKDIKNDISFYNRSVKVSSLEATALKRYVRGLERLQKLKDRDGINKLLERIRNSGLDVKLAGQQINEATYMDELNATLDGFDNSIDSDESPDQDPEKSRFLSDIDVINEAEESGDFKTALEAEDTLVNKLTKESKETEGADLD